PRRSNADAPGLSSEARKGESPERIGPLRAGDPSRQGLARDAGAQGRSGSSSADAAEQKAAKETQTEAGAGADQPQLLRTEKQDRRPAAGQQESSRTLTDSPPRISFEATKGESLGRIGALEAGDASRQGLARDAGAPSRAGSSSANAAEQM